MKQQEIEQGHMWIELTHQSGVPIYVNFGQVASVSRLATGMGLTRLHTSGGDIDIQEDLDYIKSQIAI